MRIQTFNVGNVENIEKYHNDILSCFQNLHETYKSDGSPHIICLQELSHADATMLTTKYSNNIHIMLQTSYARTNDKDRSSIKHTYGKTYNAIMWSQFLKIVKETDPDYWEDEKRKKPSIENLEKFIGVRSTRWITLQDINNNNIYTIISVHGKIDTTENINSKGARLLLNLLSDAKNYTNPIIAGDLNVENERLKTILLVSGTDSKIKGVLNCILTHKNYDEKSINFGKEYCLDWVLFNSTYNFNHIDILTIKILDKDKDKDNISDEKILDTNNISNEQILDIKNEINKYFDLYHTNKYMIDHVPVTYDLTLKKSTGGFLSKYFGIF
jgi:hypothetical protein